jgi:hypothetical protein
MSCRLSFSKRNEFDTIADSASIVTGGHVPSAAATG